MHTKYIFLNCFFALLTMQQTLTSAFDSTTGPKRSLQFFINTDIETMTPKDPVLGEFIISLGQKSGPMICSTLLFSKLVESYKNNFYKIKYASAIVSKNEILDEDRIALHFASSKFNPNDWLIKEINSSFCLLIPLIYIQKLGIRPSQYKEYTTCDTATPVELLLGLKVNHMKTMYFQTLASKSASDKDFSDALYDEATNKSRIFCLSSEYRLEKQQPPQWIFYMSGHGSIQNFVAGITVDIFKNFLHFMSSKITTVLLAYQSCYANGLTTEAIYTDVTSGIQKTYPFAIIANGITDLPVKIFATSTQSLEFDPAVTSDFNEFLKQALNDDTINYRAVAQSLFKNNVYGKDLPQITYIKLPGLEWFSILQDTKTVFSIGKNLASSRTKPLKIESYVKEKPKIIAILAQYIPFEIILEGIAPEAIISMSPGNAVHYIEKITSYNALPSIIKIFTNTEPGIRKRFVIGEITSKAENDSIKNVVFDYNIGQKKWAVRYLREDKLFSHDGETEQLIQAPEEIEDYMITWDAWKYLLHKDFIQSPLVNFDFECSYQKKRIELETSIIDLFDLQNQLNILKAMQRLRKTL